MINSKKAVDTSAMFMKDVMPNVENPLLEEIELSDDGHFWVITYSFDDPIPLGTEVVTVKPRKFKSIKINNDTGEVIAMKIRQKG